MDMMDVSLQCSVVCRDRLWIPALVMYNGEDKSDDDEEYRVDIEKLLDLIQTYVQPPSISKALDKTIKIFKEEEKKKEEKKKDEADLKEDHSDPWTLSSQRGIALLIGLPALFGLVVLILSQSWKRMG